MADQTAHVGAPEPHPEATALGLDAPQWIALAMVLVFVIIVWKRVPQIIAAALDKKIASIREQLDEAAQLRAEAEALKAEYEAKAAAADAERATMLERARHEAEDKIAAAERHAVDQVRARAASAAAAAAARLIAEDMDAGTDKALVDRTIEGLGTH
jgi:F-type H+-transporting ATPase subunit b